MYLPTSLAIVIVLRVSHKFVLTFNVERKEGKFYCKAFFYHTIGRGDLGNIGRVTLNPNSFRPDG